MEAQVDLLEPQPFDAALRDLENVLETSAFREVIASIGNAYAAAAASPDGLDRLRSCQEIVHGRYQTMGDLATYVAAAVDAQFDMWAALSEVASLPEGDLQDGDRAQIGQGQAAEALAASLPKELAESFRAVLAADGTAAQRRVVNEDQLLARLTEWWEKRVTCGLLSSAIEGMLVRVVDVNDAIAQQLRAGQGAGLSGPRVYSELASAEIPASVGSAVDSAAAVPSEPEVSNFLDGLDSPTFGPLLEEVA
jgi:hypothetical protein